MASPPAGDACRESRYEHAEPSPRSRQLPASREDAKSPPTPYQGETQGRGRRAGREGERKAQGRGEEPGHTLWILRSA